MIIKATDQGFVLEEADDFSRLYVDAQGRTPAELGELAAAHVSVIPRPDAEHLWVSEAFLRGEGSNGERDAQFARLLGFAKERGWYDEETKSVRAHIENLAG